MSPEEDTYLPGTLFGSYQIVRPLGAGGYGSVYEALRVDQGQRVALKILHERLSRSPQALRRFVREAGVVARLRHPFIVDAYDYGDVDGVPFLAMEYLDGETLAAAIAREGPMSVPDALDLVVPLLSALAAVHEQGIVHRDLKPANVFLVREPAGRRPKLLDFGIVKVQGAEQSLTHSTAIVGTPSYMSPEQVHESKHVDARSDLWSMGVILYECLTGRRLFDGDTLLQQLNSVTTAPIPPLRALRPDAPAALEEAVSMALQRDVTRRVESARTLGAALLPLASPGTQGRFLMEFPEARLGSDTLVNLPVVAPQPTVTLESPPPFTEPSSLPTRELQRPPAARPTSVFLAAAVACILVFAAAFVVSSRQPPRTATTAPTLQVRSITPTPTPTHPIVPAASPPTPSPPAPAPPVAVAPAAPIVASPSPTPAVAPVAPVPSARQQEPVSARPQPSSTPAARDVRSPHERSQQPPARTAASPPRNRSRVFRPGRLLQLPPAGGIEMP